MVEMAHAGELPSQAQPAELESRTVSELRSIAAELKIRGRSSMRKAELIEAIRNAARAHE